MRDVRRSRQCECPRALCRLALRLRVRSRQRQPRCPPPQRAAATARPEDDGTARERLLPFAPLLMGQATQTRLCGSIRSIRSRPNSQLPKSSLERGSRCRGGHLYARVSRSLRLSSINETCKFGVYYSYNETAAPSAARRGRPAAPRHGFSGSLQNQPCSEARRRVQMRPVGKRALHMVWCVS